MNVHPSLRAALLTASALAALTPCSHALDLKKANPLSWFKGKEETVPSLTEKQVQEAAAQSMLRDARTAQSTGNGGKAQSLYKEVVNRYRFTDAASVAQFEYARLIRANGKLKDSFDAFQKFISDYRQSPQFATAVQQQFEIAEEARSGKKEAKLLIIPMKVDKSELIAMYQRVIANSPYGRYAPYAQFAIGEVYQDAGEKANANAAFQAVVENYPSTKLASEAQFRIGAISSQAASKTRDAQNLTIARDALETYRATNPTGERIGETDTLRAQNTESLAVNAFEIGQFYEKSGKPKAAAIYYNEAAGYGTTDSALKARERLAALASAYPDELKNGPMVAVNTTVPAAVNLKSRDDYAGPPAPVALGKKPQMRVEDDNFRPIPIQEPDLPTRSSEPTQPGMILPPASGGPSLPVPPPLGTPEMKAPSLEPDSTTVPPVPPAPEAKSDAPAAPEAPATPETATPAPTEAGQN